MKHIFFVIICIFSLSIAQGQNITHIVKTGETLSGIAKQYKVSLRDVELINNLNDKVIIRVGQKIVIPNGKATAANTSTTPTKPALNNNNNLLGKNQYKVAAGDNMTKIARMFNVQEKQLLEWNNMKNDLILIGQVLYISKPENFSPKKLEPSIAKVENKPEVKEIKVAETKPQVTEPVKTNTAIQTNTAVKPENNETTAPIAEVKKTEPISLPKQEQNIATNIVSSAFENSFTATGKSNIAKASTFKTGAGWQDKKFYILSNTIAIGTTVKLNYKTKSTFAKVLGTLPQQQNEEQVQLRMSTATAASIGAFETIFDVEVVY
jgi:LysM repeat protein